MIGVLNTEQQSRTRAENPHYGSIMEPNFSMKVVETFRKPLQRQTYEGLLIGSSKEGTLMNRRGEGGQNLPPKLEVVDPNMDGQNTTTSTQRKRTAKQPKTNEQLGENERVRKRAKTERQGAHTPNLGSQNGNILNSSNVCSQRSAETPDIVTESQILQSNRQQTLFQLFSKKNFNDSETCRSDNIKGFTSMTFNLSNIEKLIGEGQVIKQGSDITQQK